jgi:glycosyltransferase involved in cell wall biosynthesis
MSRSRLRSALANWRVGRALRRCGSGLAHFHFFGHYGALQRGVRWSRVKSVVHVHLQMTETDVRWAFKQPPNLVLTCSRILAEQIRAMMPRETFARTRIEGLPNPVDVERFTPGDRAEARRRVGAPLEAPLLLMLANLAPHKGQETVIRTVASLRARGIETVCWLAGIERGGATEKNAQARNAHQGTRRCGLCSSARRAHRRTRPVEGL